jgi:hypothetical protein
MIGVYFQSWSSPWVNSGDSMDLSKIKNADIVYLAFASPDMTYNKNQNSFANTGLQFSHDFSVVKKAISILKERAILVMLSVGGGSYWSTPKKCNYESWIYLMNDLGCSGIDIDWEVNCSDDVALTTAIQKVKSLSSGKVSFAGWSTGAYGKDGDTYKGMNIHAMANAGYLVDWINVMCYDAGTTYDPIGAIASYRIYYKGPLMLGFEVGNHAWGNALLTQSEVIKNCTWMKNENSMNGIFLWSWQKGNDGKTITGGEVLDISGSILPKRRNQLTPSPPPPSPSVPESKNDTITCPNCNKMLILKIA